MPSESSEPMCMPSESSEPHLCHPSQVSRHLCHPSQVSRHLCHSSHPSESCHPSQSDEPSAVFSVTIQVSQTSLQHFHPSQASHRLCQIDKLLYFGVPTLCFVGWGVPSVLVITVRFYRLLCSAIALTAFDLAPVRGLVQ
jgi:hypothetical protein